MHSDRIELQIRAWSEGRIQHRQSVTVHPTIQMDTVVLGSDISRGTMFHEDNLAVETRWLPPSASTRVATLIGAVGQIASSRLRSGSVLSKKDIAREFVIKRGDRVMVRCIVGGIVITLEAEARSDGAIDERVELRKLGERDTFFATVTASHAAVMDLNR